MSLCKALYVCSSECNEASIPTIEVSEGHLLDVYLGTKLRVGS